MAWAYSIELNKLLSDFDSKYDFSIVEEECPKEVLDATCEEISKSIFLSKFKCEVKKCKSIAAFNRVLEKIYNEADRRRIWCGF